jgi:hypothetical protein
MVSAIKNDKKKIKHGVVRYELLKDLSGEINCIDKDLFYNHTEMHIKQGFYEFKRLNVKLQKINCELVVMRHRDESKFFEQYDGLLSGYLKADCELCYYEVIF